MVCKAGGVLPEFMLAGEFVLFVEVFLEVREESQMFNGSGAVKMMSLTDRLTTTQHKKAQVPQVSSVYGRRQCSGPFQAGGLKDRRTQIKTNGRAIVSFQ